MALPRKPKFSPQTEAPVEPQVKATVEPVTPEPVTPEPTGPKPLKLLATGWSLLEPHENIWFTAGKPREVYRITKWMQAQINAGLLKYV